MRCQEPKVGTKFHLDGVERVLIWCPCCSGQGVKGHIDQFGLYMADAKGAVCDTCGGQRKILAKSDTLKEWVEVQKHIEINVLHRRNPLETFRYTTALAS